jgi:hypothetical protein
MQMHTTTAMEPDATAAQDGFRVTLAVTNGHGLTIWLSLNQREAHDLSVQLSTAAAAASAYEHRGARR